MKFPFFPLKHLATLQEFGLIKKWIVTLLTGVGLANVLYVSEDGNDLTAKPNSLFFKFRTVTRAMQVADDGDMVFVGPGNFTGEHVAIQKNRISLVGSGKDSTTITSADPNWTVAANAPMTDLTIKDCKITNTGGGAAIRIFAPVPLTAIQFLTVDGVFADSLEMIEATSVSRGTVRASQIGTVTLVNVFGFRFLDGSTITQLNATNAGANPVVMDTNGVELQGGSSVDVVALVGGMAFTLGQDSTIRTSVGSALAITAQDPRVNIHGTVGLRGTPGSGDIVMGLPSPTVDGDVILDLSQATLYGNLQLSGPAAGNRTRVLARGVRFDGPAQAILIGDRIDFDTRGGTFINPVAYASLKANIFNTATWDRDSDQSNIAMDNPATMATALFTQFPAGVVLRFAVTPVRSNVGVAMGNVGVEVVDYVLNDGAGACKVNLSASASPPGVGSFDVLINRHPDP